MGNGGTDVGVFIQIESDKVFDRIVVGFVYGVYLIKEVVGYCCIYCSR